MTGPSDCPKVLFHLTIPPLDFRGPSLSIISPHISHSWRGTKGWLRGRHMDHVGESEGAKQPRRGKDGDVTHTHTQTH